MRLRTDEVLQRWRPGSGAWDWPTEWADIVQDDGGTTLAGLIGDIAANGIQEPILLGDDGRVWDGHHRLMVARLLGIEEVPVAYGHGGDLAQLFALAHQQGFFNGTLERLSLPVQRDDPVEIRARLKELQQRCSHEH